MAKRRVDFTQEEVDRRLAALYRRNGYVRLQNQSRVKKDGWARYKKGDEVRHVATSLRELRMIQQLLKAAGFRPSRPFITGRQYRVPIYGREAVARFLVMVSAEGDV